MNSSYYLLTFVILPAQEILYTQGLSNHNQVINGL